MNMSVMAENSGCRRKEATYVNISKENTSKDMEFLADSVGKLNLESTNPKPAERVPQVTLYRQGRTTDKEKPVKSEPLYINRAPVHAQLNTQFLQEEKARRNQYEEPTHRSGQKRGGAAGEQIYYNWDKVMKPQTPIDQQQLDQQRLNMLIRNGQPGSSRVPVENDDRSAYIYHNGGMIGQSAHDYHNLPTRPQQLCTPTTRAPLSTPRPNPVSTERFAPVFSHSVPISQGFTDEQAFTDFVLNSPATSVYANVTSTRTLNCSSNTGPSIPRTTYQQSFNPTPISGGYQNYAAPLGYKSPQNRGSCQPSCQPSPAQHMQTMSPGTPHSQSQTGSPPSYRDGVGSPLSQCSYSHLSPSSQQPPSQTGSPPPVQSYSNSIFSPSHLPAYSPPGESQTGSSESCAATMMSSPAGSQTVPSPFTDVNSPGELSLYQDAIKPSLTFQSENLTCNSLTDDLQNLPEWPEAYQPNLVTTANAVYNTNGNPTYPISNNITTPQCPYQLPGPEDTTPCVPTPLPSHAPRISSADNRSSSIRVPVTSAPVASVANKLPIPALPRPQPTPTQQPVVLLLIKPAEKKQPARILPRPSGDAPAAPPTTTSKPKGKNAKTNKNKGGAAKSGSSRGAQSNVETETIRAQAMVGLERDESLLRTENGHTILHQSIIKKQQAVTLALLQAVHRRPALGQLINMKNGKNQTPLFLSVITGQFQITEILVKQCHANCDTLCGYQECEGQVESQLNALHYACKYGERCLRAVKAMLSSSSTVVDTLNNSGMTALHLAVWNHGQMDGKSKRPIDNKNVVKALLDAGAQCNITDVKTGKTALHFAVEIGSLEMTKLILESNCQLETLIDQKNYDKRTALHFAASLHTTSEENKIDLVKYLMSKGANKNSKDKNKLMPRELVNPSQTKLLELFNESLSPPRPYDDDDTFQSLLLQSP